MATYKTPGVYVEEIASLPASVAQVETALPAFIGYTEKHEDTDGTSLLNVPTRISSMVEFREKFGGAPPLDVTSIEINGLNQVTGLTKNDQFYMFDALRMFYANGGGDCFIVSVNTYQSGGATNTPQLGAADGSSKGFLAGLAQLEKADAPTLLVAPDAVAMDGTNLSTLQVQMLTHANKMQDRFCVFDMRENALELDDAIDEFRSGIGVNYLKYGATYGPWIKANLPKEVAYSDIKGKIKRSGTAVTLISLADPTSDEAKFTATRLDNIVDDIKTNLDARIFTVFGTNDLDDKYETLYQSMAAETDSTALKTKYEALVDFYAKAIHLFDGWLDTITPGANKFVDALSAYSSYPSLTSGKTYLFDEVKSYVGGTLASVGERFLDHIKDGQTPMGSTYDPSDAGSFTWVMKADAGIWNNKMNALPAAAVTPIFGTTGVRADKLKPALPALRTMWADIKSALDYVNSVASSISSATQQSAEQQIPTLKTVMTFISKSLTEMPPSGAIVGVYAATDRGRGVWKAPANVSLASTAGVRTIVSNEKQENMNVDTTAGKSINAIRPFTGKGILVWGARTLAGNDNEWRYVPVRRLYLMVEESIKKATEFVVFEPNDANTWVRVKGMVTNYLTELWKQGALAGAKPDAAFFVNVGLGETMTPQDILEGRMIVEIGMAAVRPAEFIILRFYHKLQES